MNKEEHQEKSSKYKALDYKLKTSKERCDYVNKIIAETDPQLLTNKYLEYLGDYILSALDNKKGHEILTNNRMVTVNKRETSFEGLSIKFEAGEDAIYGLLNDNKNILLSPKNIITKKDVETIPELKELRKAIQIVEEKEKKAVGKDKYILKKQLIDLRQDQYIIKENFYQPVPPAHNNKLMISPDIEFVEEVITIDEKGKVSSNARVTLFNYQHVACLLSYYEELWHETKDKLSNDMHYLLEDLDKIIETYLKPNYPYYYDLLRYKLQNLSNVEIVQKLTKKYDFSNTPEYLSHLWKNKIPKLIAEKAQDDYVNWYYQANGNGIWKTCSKCGQKKLAHIRFFSRNKTSRDGFYSICKTCRNKPKGVIPNK